MNYLNKITPENITKLKENERFVYGSNMGGKNYGGAALMASKKWGAESIGEGYTGLCYAIPTLTSDFKKRELSDIQKSVHAFINYAKQFENVPIYFLVTEIGTGIAGFSKEEIAPMFQRAIYISNIYLPKNFIQILTTNN